MPVLHNRISQEELKRRLMEETEPRTTISFYQYFFIDEPQVFRDQLYLHLNALKVFGRIYVAQEGINAQTLKLDGTESFALAGLGENMKPQQDLVLKITRASGQTEQVTVRGRIDTPIEIEYYKHGGILPYVLRQLLANA